MVGEKITNKIKRTDSDVRRLQRLLSNLSDLLRTEPFGAFLMRNYKCVQRMLQFRVFTLCCFVMGGNALEVQ